MLCLILFKALGLSLSPASSFFGTVLTFSPLNRVWIGTEMKPDEVADWL